MKRVWWYSVNVYPKTKHNELTVAVIKRYGYHYHCVKHEKNTCPNCVDFGESKFLRVVHAVPVPQNDVDTVLVHALNAVIEGDQRINIPADYLHPLARVT